MLLGRVLGEGCGLKKDKMFYREREDSGRRGKGVWEIIWDIYAQTNMYNIYPQLQEFSIPSIYVKYLWERGACRPLTLLCSTPSVILLFL